MHKQLLYLLLFFSPFPCFAQIAGNGENPYYYGSRQRKLQMDYKAITFLEGDTIYKDISKLELSYRNTSGGFHKSQEPYSSRNATLYTEGVYAFNRIKVAGSFLIDKQWDDSLKNNLNGEFDDDTPYYYFANKAGKFERQNYKFNGSLSYRLNSVWSAGMGLDYNYHWTTGSVDPRPDVKIFNYLLKPELVYHSNGTYLGVQGNWGHGTENSGIVYKNRNYSTSLLYPDRIFYMNHGYGYITMMDQSIYQRRRSYLGGALHFRKNSHLWTYMASIGYLHRHDGNTKEKYGSSHLEYYSKWNLSTWKAEALVEHHGSHFLQQWSAYFNMQSGRDWDSIFNANNYQYHLAQFRLQYSLLQQEKSRAYWGLLGSLHYISMEKKDLLQAHHINYSILEPQLAFHLYSRINNANRLNLSLAPSVTLPMKTYLSVPLTQINVFTQNIVYPDYYYWASRTLKLSFGADWISGNLLPKKDCGFFAHVRYARQLDTSTVEYAASYKPGTSRWDWQLGLRLYL